MSTALARCGRAAGLLVVAPPHRWCVPHPRPSSLFQAGRIEYALGLAVPFVLANATQTITSYFRGVEIVPLILYPIQFHYAAHTIGGVEIGQQTLRFTGIRNILVALESGPVMVTTALLIIDLDNNNDPGRGVASVLLQMGDAMLLFMLFCALVNILCVLVGDLKPKKLRVSRLKPVDTLGVTLKERSTVLVVSASEVLGSVFLYALLMTEVGAGSAMNYLLAAYGLHIFSWRWWTKRINQRGVVFMFALVFSIPNMFGVIFTAGARRACMLPGLGVACAAVDRNLPYATVSGPTTGDAETSYVYQFRKPLTQEETEFLHSGVWLPDYLGLHAVRMVITVALMALPLGSIFSEALGISSPADTDSHTWRNIAAMIVFVCLLVQNVAIALHFDLKRRGVLAWGRAAQSRLHHRARMDERKARHKARFGEKLGSSTDSDDSPGERRRRAKERKRRHDKWFRKQPKSYQKWVLFWSAVSDFLTCGRFRRAVGDCWFGIKHRRKQRRKARAAAAARSSRSVKATGDSGTARRRCACCLRRKSGADDVDVEVTTVSTAPAPPVLRRRCCCCCRSRPPRERAADGCTVGSIGTEAIGVGGPGSVESKEHPEGHRSGSGTLEVVVQPRGKRRKGSRNSRTSKGSVGSLRSGKVAPSPGSRRTGSHRATRNGHATPTASTPGSQRSTASKSGKRKAGKGSDSPQAGRRD